MFQAHQNEGHFSMIHTNIHFMFEIPNPNYNNNLSNAIVISLVIFLNLVSYLGPTYLSKRKQQKKKSMFLYSGFLFLAKADTNIRYCGSRNAVLITEK